MLLVALVLFAAGLWSELPQVVDDLYISYAYALSLLETGTLTYAGARVEGYSNLSWVLALAAGRVAGLPVTWVAKVLGIVSAVGVIVWTHRNTPRGSPLVLAVGGWAALAVWAGRGMETPLFALLLMVGWGAAVRAFANPGMDAARGLWRVASWALLGAALTRPEGAVYLAGWVGLRLLAGQPAADPASWVPLLVFAAYNAARFAWFGELLPLTVIAKSAGSPDQWDGARQLGLEWVGALPLLVAAVGTWRSNVRIGALAAAPLALHAAMLLVMNGDWMGATRIQLPGLLAAIAAFSAGETRVRRWAWVALPLLLWAPSRNEGLVPRWRGPFTADPFTLETPLIADVRVLVHLLPEGARFETGDIGVPGLIPWGRLVDTVGLVSPLRAFVAAGRAPREALDADYTGPDAIACVRRVFGDRSTRDMGFRRRMSAYPITFEVDRMGHRHLWWCRAGLEAPPDTVVRARWLALLDRLPELPAIRWHAARWLYDHGEQDAARALHAVEPWIDPDPEVAFLVTQAPLPDTPEAAGYRLPPGTSLHTRALERAPTVGLQLDGPRGVPVAFAWEHDGRVLNEWAAKVPVRVTLDPPTPGARLRVTRPEGNSKRKDERPLWVRVAR